MITHELSQGINCQTVWSPVVMAASSFETCYELGIDELGSFASAEVIKICQDYIPDLKILCYVFCCCKNNPAPSQSGKTNQYQQCVQNTLDAADELMAGGSRFKAEMPYNMMTSPPSPMTSRMPGRGLFPSKNWPHNPDLYGLPNPYPSGVGLVRRPDVVIVNDRSKPATADNIKQIVEMKFPGDPLKPQQIEEYKNIHETVETIDGESGTCNCEEEEKKFRDAAMKSIILGILMSLLGRGAGRGKLMPKPVPGGGGVPVPGVI